MNAPSEQDIYEALQLLIAGEHERGATAEWLAERVSLSTRRTTNHLTALRRRGLVRMVTPTDHGPSRYFLGDAPPAAPVPRPTSLRDQILDWLRTHHTAEGHTAAEIRAEIPRAGVPPTLHKLRVEGFVAAKEGEDGVLRWWLAELATTLEPPAPTEPRPLADVLEDLCRQRAEHEAAIAEHRTAIAEHQGEIDALDDQIEDLQAKAAAAERRAAEEEVRFCSEAMAERFREIDALRARKKAAEDRLNPTLFPPREQA